MARGGLSSMSHFTNVGLTSRNLTSNPSTIGAAIAKSTYTSFDRANALSRGGAGWAPARPTLTTTQHNVVRWHRWPRLNMPKRIPEGADLFTDYTQSVTVLGARERQSRYERKTRVDECCQCAPLRANSR